MRVLAKLVLLALSIAVFGACAAPPANYAPQAQAPAATASAGGTASFDMAPMSNAERGFSYESSENLIQSEERRAPRRIKSGSMSVEAEDVESAMISFENLTLTYGGWIEQRNLSSRVNSRHAGMVLRIPAAYYDEFILAASNIATVMNFEDRIIDVSAEYFDSEARLNINRAEEQSLLIFIENATSMEDIIQLEARLADVRTEIERHENNMRRIDRDVSFSTLSVTFQERGAATIRPIAANLGTRMGDGFSSSVSGVVSFVENLIIMLAYLSVPLVICGLCAAVGVMVYRKQRVKKA